MTGTDKVQLEKVIVHKVGNPTRGEQLVLSKMPLTLNDERVQQLLTKYFLNAFNEHEQFRFHHLSDVGMNEVYSFANEIFTNGAAFAPYSALIAQFLYGKSTHARVKEGELYVALMQDVPFENDFVTALGIFKSESKESFLKVFTHGQNIEVAAEEGVNISKPDKGCLILRTQEGDGYRVLVVDHTNKNNDAQYWVQDFLQVAPVANEYRHTHEFLQLCRDFATGEMPEKFEVNKQEQIEMMQRSLDYFKTKEQFDYNEFTQEVIHHPEVIEQFAQFRDQYAQARQVEWDESFDIDLAAVKKQGRVFKSVLKLDKNFHIYIHGRRDLIERGYDAEKGKHYYKVYFEEEQ
ncbi:MAG TPA: nucleoid-associated protein [Phnomibacter sp.]|nr:nucleoid-associated protein [Phnomibacter sp.]